MSHLSVTNAQSLLAKKDIEINNLQNELLKAKHEINELKALLLSLTESRENMYVNDDEFYPLLNPSNLVSYSSLRDSVGENITYFDERTDCYVTK